MNEKEYQALSDQLKVPTLQDKQRIIRWALLYIPSHTEEYQVMRSEWLLISKLIKEATKSDEQIVKQIMGKSENQ